MIDKYDLGYADVVCTGVNWETREFYFIFRGKEYVYKQQGDIRCTADTDHIRCVIAEFKENLMKKEENSMENYIVINGKKATVVIDFGDGRTKDYQSAMCSSHYADKTPCLHGNHPWQGKGHYRR